MAQPGNKITYDNCNFIDILIFKLCNCIDQPLHNLGVTPNMVTVFGLIMGLISIFLFIKKQYIASIIFLWFTYFTDCLDGYMARKYNQITKLGDYLDHFRDQFVIVTVIVLVFMQIRDTSMKILFLTSISVYGIMMLAQLGCQERLTHVKEGKDCLDILQHLCPGNAEKTMAYAKWFGCPTFFIVLSIFILLLKAKLV